MFTVLNSLIVFTFLAASFVEMVHGGVLIWSDNRANLGEIYSHILDRNAFCVGFQKPHAFMSRRASSPTITDL